MRRFIILVGIVLLVTSIIFIPKILSKNNEQIMQEVVIPKHVEPPFVSSISIDYLRTLDIDSPAPEILEELSEGSNYKRYLASYESEGNTIYGLLTVPNEKIPEGGFPAIVFNHGYIPPQNYITTERYISYVDNLAKNGFVVFKIDLRGHGKSEGIATGSYFSSAYTIDAISALRSLQKLNYVNPDRIGMWGHSMAGNLVLRAMEVEDDIKAGVIWAGAVYSYEDFAKYRIQDTSYVRRDRDPHYDARDLEGPLSEEVSKLRSGEDVDFDDEFWSSISLTKNINYLNSPIQLNHSTNDATVNVGYSKDLVEILKENNKNYEFHEYSGGGHNIESPYFEQAIRNTINFFKENL